MTFYSFNGKKPHNKNNWFEFKTQMKLAGWTVPKSSDGLTYNASGDQITVDATSGAGGIGNSSWYVLSHPTLEGVQRHWCLQFDSSGYVRIKVSWTGFSGGSPGITRVPSAADEKVLFGSNTDASPSYASFFATEQGSNNIFIMCGDSSEKYSFYMFSISQINVPVAIISMDRLTQTNASDVDPYTYAVAGLANFNSTNVWLGNGLGQPFAWYKKGLVGENFVRTPCGKQGSYNGFAVGGIGTNPYDGTVDLMQMLFFRSNSFLSELGWKGISTLFLEPGLVRSPGTLITKSTLNDYVYFCNDFVAVWDGSETIL